MTDKLPPNLLALFAPRPPLRYLPPSDHAPEDRSSGRIGGVAAFLPAVKEYQDNDGYKETESWLQKHDRMKTEKRERHKELLSEGINDCRQYDRACKCYKIAS